MPNIIGTIISVERLLKNEETRVFIKQGNDEDSPIVLEENREYVIPDFQREVRWSRENIIELMSDINDGDRFLGNIILSKRQNLKYEIIDGQQRITMLLMLLKYIKYVSGNSVDVYSTCDFLIESFPKFQDLLNHYFNYVSMPPQEKVQIDDSDIFNQRKRYKELWNAIEASGIITSGTSRSFLTKLSRCELNILLNTAMDGGYSIQYFLDVNLKGVRLDTEDILKSYLFSYDTGNDIRHAWRDLKKNIFETENYTSKYTLIKVVEQFLHCNLFQQTVFKDSGVKFNEKFQLKSAKIVNGVRYYKNDHIIKVINNNEYIRNSFAAINEYLKILINIISIDGVNEEFRNMFIVNGQRLLQDNEIKIIHNLLKKIILDDNVVPKILVMKYMLDIFILNDTRSRSDVKKIYGIYCLSILFTVFDDKRSSSQITDIVKMDNWNAGVISQINRYLNSDLTAKRLSAKYSVVLLNAIDEDLTDEEDIEREDSDDKIALNNYQYRCKSLATIYNYFKINRDNVSVSSIDSLYMYLNDERLYSIEHFILNKSEKYSISIIEGEIPYPNEIKKYVNSLFNFIFITRNLNGSLGNMHISDKLLALNSNPINIECEYSQMISVVCNEIFANKPNITGRDNEDVIKKIYNEYYESTFLSDYTDYAEKVIKKVVEKIRNQ
jgi:hypothetical protein